MYRPDPSIVRQLKECDPDLDVRWRGTHWWVTCRGKDTVKVRNADGSYRPLDGRIVTRMREEAWRIRNKKFSEIDAEEEAGNTAIMHSRVNQRRDEFRQYCIEDVHPRVVGFGTGRNVFRGWDRSAGA